MSTTFDGLPGLDATITSVVLTDLDGNPNRVVDDSASFDITVDWTVTPPATAALLDGTWTIRAFAESIGPDPDAILGSLDVAANGGLTYSGTINVPAGGLQADDATHSGVYAPVVVITYRNTLNVITEMAGFARGPVFMVRTP